MPLWSSAILEELVEHEALKLMARGTAEADARDRAEHLYARITEAFSGSEIKGLWHLEGTFGLPDVDDEHVVAAAVVAEADTIVTANLKHFPRDRIPAEIRIQDPATFAHRIVEANLGAAREAVRQIAQRSGRHGTKLNESEILDLLEGRYAMGAAVVALR